MGDSQKFNFVFHECVVGSECARLIGVGVRLKKSVACFIREGSQILRALISTPPTSQRFPRSK